MINLKKTAIATSIAITMGLSSNASADFITMSFDGLFTLADPFGSPLQNNDSASNQDYGFRTNVSGSAVFDSNTGAGYGDITPFSFFGSGLASATNVTFQAIGNGQGGQGTLVAAAMSFNWNGNYDIPVTLILDASGFFASLQFQGGTWTVGTDCTGCGTSSTADWVLGPLSSPLSGSVGAVPMAMTTLNTAGTTLGSLFPLSFDGISGSPMTTTPFPGFNANFDFTSITATYTGVVPVPAAVWLFGSGLIGLVGVARRRSRKL